MSQPTAPHAKSDLEDAIPMRLHVPWTTFAKLLGFAVLVFLLYKLLPFFMLLFLSTLLAVAFEPLTERLGKHIGRKLSVTAVAVVTGAALLGTIVLIVPQMVEQVTGLYKQLPTFADKLGNEVPPLSGFLHRLPQKLATPDADAVSPLLNHLATFGGMALGSLSSLALIFAFMVYLLLDGSRLYAWFTAFFRAGTRQKIERTCEGVVPVISAYVIGQMITSLLCAIFTFAVLSWVGVPGALVLAFIAAVFDVLPIVGFFLFTIPAALVAATVSPKAALIVILLFGTYHLIEAYVISPVVYGNRLRVSGLVVLFSLVAGASIGGVLAAILVLPIVASYPVIEEIWLSNLIGDRVVSKHKRLADEVEDKQEAVEPELPPLAEDFESPHDLSH